MFQLSCLCYKFTKQTLHQAAWQLFTLQIDQNVMHRALYARISKLEKNATQVILTVLILARKKPPEVLLACRNVFPDTPNYVNTCAYEHSFYVRAETHSHNNIFLLHTLTVCVHSLRTLMRHASISPWQRIVPDQFSGVRMRVHLLSLVFTEQQHIIQVHFTVLLTSGCNLVISSTQTADWQFACCLSLLL